jgi:ABC-type nitrate/sulfonate/bicarbonate transport system ATPase subunit
MQHRVALARALINEPSILLMDEPFSALDAITRTAMRRFLLSLWEQQKSTIVFVTHDVDEATLLADRVCVMTRNPGRVADVVPVELPRPRDIEDVETVEFLAARRQIRRALELAMGQTR